MSFTDMLVLPDFLDASTCAEILGELRNAPVAQATVYGTSAAGTIDRGTRSTKAVAASRALHERLRAKIEAALPRLAAHFATTLDSIESLQFLRYGVGDFFVAHQDGNTPLIHDETRHRKVSIVIFLSRCGDYDGGSLTFHGPYPDFDAREEAAAEAGSLLAFRSETTHEVTPLTHGERFTVATWLR
jgi:predicted 2-oxoglutarate/Fe(II)-dependent dioxygenase YbiX